jgi:hypothetical protein
MCTVIFGSTTEAYHHEPVVRNLLEDVCELHFLLQNEFHFFILDILTMTALPHGVAEARRAKFKRMRMVVCFADE